MNKIRKSHNKTINQQNNLKEKQNTKQKKGILNNNSEILKTNFSHTGWSSAYTVEEINGSYTDNVVYG